MTLSIQIVQIPSNEVVGQREFYLTEAKVAIGRDYSADICLPDLSEKMSRTHIVIERNASGDYLVTDTSTNGTALNSAPLTPKAPVVLSDGDVLSFIGYKMLIGLVSRSQTEKSPAEATTTPPNFKVETNLGDETPIVPDAEIEDIREDFEKGFSEGGLDLDPDLMFDPFAEGPELDEDIATPSRPTAEVSETDIETSSDSKSVEFSTIVSMPEQLAHHSALPELFDSSRQAAIYRDKVIGAAEKSLEKFLDEIDPKILQTEYDDFMPRFGRRKSRYWSIHLRQFAKRKANGNFRRNFMALLAEELRKL